MPTLLKKGAPQRPFSLADERSQLKVKGAIKAQDLFRNERSIRFMSYATKNNQHEARMASLLHSRANLLAADCIAYVQHIHTHSSR